jgi:uncharacterized membrane protein YidH (DUF202 family)
METQPMTRQFAVIATIVSTVVCCFGVGIGSFVVSRNGPNAWNYNWLALRPDFYFNELGVGLILLGIPVLIIAAAFWAIAFSVVHRSQVSPFWFRFALILVMISFFVLGGITGGIESAANGGGPPAL